MGSLRQSVAPWAGFGERTVRKLSKNVGTRAGNVPANLNAPVLPQIDTTGPAPQDTFWRRQFKGTSFTHRRRGSPLLNELSRGDPLFARFAD